MAAVGVAGELRRDVADTFLFRHEAVTVLVDEDAALAGEVPPTAVRTVTTVDAHAAGVRSNVLHMGERDADVTHRDPERRTVVGGAADRDTLAGNGGNPEVQRLSRTRDAARGEHDTAVHLHFVGLAGVDVLCLDTDDLILLRVEVDLGKRSHGVDLDLALFDLLHEHIDVILTLVAFLTDGAQVAVAGVGFEVMRSEAVVFEPVKGFAGMLRKEFDGFAQRHVGTVVHDVVRKCLPAVLGAFALLDGRTVGGEKAAAHTRRAVVGRHGLIEHDDLTPQIVSLASSHQTGAARTENSNVHGHRPLRGKLLIDGSGKSRESSGSSGAAGSGGNKTAAGNHLIGHDLFSLELNILKGVAVLAHEAALTVHAVAFGAVHATHMGIMRVGVHVLRGLRELRIRHVAGQALGLFRSLRGHGLMAGRTLQGSMGTVGRTGGERRCGERKERSGGSGSHQGGKSHF